VFLAIPSTNGSGSLLVIPAARYWRRKNEFSSLSLPSSLQNILSYVAGKGARSNGAKALRDLRMGKNRASEACFLLRTQNPVERLVRDGVLSEKEAQLSRMFLHVAQGVQ
jgi:hypothetical protein